MYFPSGEYSGVESEPGEVEIFFGFPPATGTTKISLLVEIAPTSSRLLVKATSCESGEKAYMSCPPRENGGASWSPGVRSLGVPHSNPGLADVGSATGVTKMCVRLSPV